MANRVLLEDFEIVPQLAKLRLPRERLLDVLDRAAGERANVTASDPSGTYGLEMRRWATRFLRDAEDLRRLGWVACAHNQVEGIRNDELRLKIAFMNTDAATGMPSKMPQSIADKGPVSEALIRRNYNADQGKLFDEPAIADPIASYDFWYLCAHVRRRSITAEISRPVGLKNGIVCDFSLRVILWQPGEKEGFQVPDTVPEDFAEIERPSISRKA